MMSLTPIDESGLPGALRELLAEVRNLGSAPVHVYAGNPQNLAGTAGGKHEWESRNGPSTVIVLPHGDDWLLAHELLHVSFLRRGFPVVSLARDDVPTGVGELANLIEDAVIHPVLWHELRLRGFDDSAYWWDQWANLDTADGPEVPLREHTGALCDAIVLADMIASAPSTDEGILGRVAIHSPLTAEIAGRLSPLLSRDSGSDAARRAGVMSAVLDTVDVLFGEHGFAGFRVGRWLSVGL